MRNIGLISQQILKTKSECRLDSQILPWLKLKITVKRCQKLLSSDVVKSKLVKGSALSDS